MGFVGELVSVTFMSTLATTGFGLVPESWGFSLAWFSASIVMAFGMVSIVSGIRQYTYKLPGSNIVAGLLYYIYQSALTSIRGALSLCGWLMMLLFFLLAVVQAFVTDSRLSQALAFTTLALAVSSSALVALSHVTNVHLEKVHPVSYLSIKDAKGALDIVPVLLMGNIALSTLWNLSFHRLLSPVL